LSARAVNPGAMPRPAIEYGDRFRIGMLTPSGNIVAEPQVKAMLPPGVSVYCTRLPLTGSSREELLAMVENVEHGTRLLADARVNLIAFNCTAVSTYSKEMEADIKTRITGAANGPVVATSEALVAALQALKAKRIGLITPYIRAVNEREVKFLEAAGFEVLVDVGLAIATNAEMGREPPERWLELVKAHRDDRVDTYLVSCTAIRSAEVIDEIEQAVGRPVITSNQALVWYCLRQGGIPDRVKGFGRLLAQH
jgi:maleate isomerase